jgi:transcriptional regulator with XRE-family HTH domain
MSHAAAQSLRKVFGDRVREARAVARLSQEALADLSGLHRTYIGSIERAERNVSIDNIERIAAALGKPAWLLLSPKPLEG